jgi:hypothetical protein
VRHPIQQYVPQKEIQKTGLSVQAPSLTHSDMFKVITVVQQIITEFSETASEKTTQW